MGDGILDLTKMLIKRGFDTEESVTGFVQWIRDELLQDHQKYDVSEIYNMIECELFEKKSFKQIQVRFYFNHTKNLAH